MPARSLIPAAAAVSITAHAAALGLVWLASSQSSSTTLDINTGASDSAPDGAVAMLWPTLPTPTPPAPAAQHDPAPTPQVEVAAAPIDPPPAMQELELLPELAQTPEPTPQPQEPATTAAQPTESAVPITLDPEAFRAIASQLRQTATTIASTLAAIRLPSHSAPAQTSASTAPAASSAPATPGGQVSSPSPSSTNKAPPYPLEARRRRQQGTVTILIDVLPTGLVGEVSLKTSSGFPLLDNAALAAAKAWHFSPATLENTPVHCQVTLPIEFSLK